MSDVLTSTTNPSIFKSNPSLSVHLYEQTLYEEYLSAATLSTTFITKQFYNGTAILDMITIGTCSLSMFLATYDLDFTIDGSSVLASVKKFHMPMYAPFRVGKVSVLANDFLPVFA